MPRAPRCAQRDSLSARSSKGEANYEGPNESHEPCSPATKPAPRRPSGGGVSPRLQNNPFLRPGGIESGGQQGTPQAYNLPQMEGCAAPAPAPPMPPKGTTSPATPSESRNDDFEAQILTWQPRPATASETAKGDAHKSADGAPLAAAPLAVAPTADDERTAPMAPVRILDEFNFGGSQDSPSSGYTTVT